MTTIHPVHSVRRQRHPALAAQPQGRAQAVPAADRRKDPVSSKRLAEVAGDDRFAAPMVVAGAAHGDLIMGSVGQLARRAGWWWSLAARNTAPAIALARRPL